MEDSKEKRGGLLRRPLLWVAALILAAGGAAFFFPIWPCPLCQGIEEVRVIHRPTRACVVCDGAKKVGLRVVLERMIH